MSKALEALENIKKKALQDCDFTPWTIPELDVFNARQRMNQKTEEEYAILERELKAFEIIKNKKVDAYTDIIDSWSYEEYVDNFNHLQKIDNGKYRQDCQLLTQEEWVSLSEVLL